LNNVVRALKIDHDLGIRPFFPQRIVIAVKKVACELPAESGVPLSRYSTQEIVREITGRGIVASISGSTVWRWLHQDAIRPWFHRSWIFPRGPDFLERACVILDLYERTWSGKRLGIRDYVLSSDEKTSIQARSRLHATLPPASARRMRVEHHYKRRGAFTYMAAWDVGRAKIFTHVTRHNGIDSFHRLVDQVMSQEPYRAARRVFWIVDNGSAHRGPSAIARLRSWYPNAILVHTPVHASWLNQIEIYFSIIQRKVLTPASATSIPSLRVRLRKFQTRYENAAHPFDWRFTKKDLKRLLSRLSKKSDADPKI
jgi:hypothetical protein